MESIRRMIDADENEDSENDVEAKGEQVENVLTEPNEEVDIGHEAYEDIGNPNLNVEALDEEAQLIIAQLQEIMIEGRDTSGTSFKIIDMKFE